MTNKTELMSVVEQHCGQIIDSLYFKYIKSESINIVLLSIFNLKKILADQNLLIAINMTKIESKHLKDLCKVLYENVCVRDIDQKFENFVLQYDMSLDYLKKNSLLIPYEVLLNELSKNIIECNWKQSIASLATTEYIFTLIFKQLNTYAKDETLKLDESNDATLNLLKILESEMNPDIEKGIITTAKNFLDLFDILCEVFFNDSSL